MLRSVKVLSLLAITVGMTFVGMPPGYAQPVAPSVTTTTASVTWTHNAGILDPNTWATVRVPLDGHKRKVLLKCGAMEGDACSREDLRINGKLLLKTKTGEAGLISAVHRVVRFPGTNGLIAVSVQRYSIGEDNFTWTPEATYSGKVYRYHKGKLVMVRNLWTDHRKLASDADFATRESADSPLSTPSFITGVSAKGNRFTVTWATPWWACTNTHPSVTYKYSKGKVKVVAHTNVGYCD